MTSPHTLITIRAGESPGRPSSALACSLAYTHAQYAADHDRAILGGLIGQALDYVRLIHEVFPDAWTRLEILPQ